MAKLYARLVRDTGMDLETVPALWREQTRAILAQEEARANGEGG